MASTNCVAASLGQERPTETELPKPPVEVDLANPAAERYLGNSGTDLFARLEELYPDDPGQLSGTELRIIDSGECLKLSAALAFSLRDGRNGYHCFGSLDAADLAETLWARQTESGHSYSIALRDQRPEVGNSYFSGATLDLVDGLDCEIRVCFGSHCLGVLRGQPLRAFLHALLARYTMGHQ